MIQKYFHCNKPTHYVYVGLSFLVTFNLNITFGLVDFISLKPQLFHVTFSHLQFLIFEMLFKVNSVTY